MCTLSWPGMDLHLVCSVVHFQQSWAHAALTVDVISVLITAYLFEYFQYRGQLQIVRVEGQRILHLPSMTWDSYITPQLEREVSVYTDIRDIALLRWTLVDRLKFSSISQVWLQWAKDGQHSPLVAHWVEVQMAKPTYMGPSTSSHLIRGGSWDLCRQIFHFIVVCKCATILDAALVITVARVRTAVPVFQMLVARSGERALAGHSRDSQGQKHYVVLSSSNLSGTLMQIVREVSVNLILSSRQRWLVLAENGCWR